MKRGETLYNNEQLDELRDTFDKINKNGSGYITKSEFYEAVKISAPHIKKGQVEFAFEVADKDHSDDISFDEFQKFYWILSHP